MRSALRAQKSPKEKRPAASASAIWLMIRKPEMTKNISTPTQPNHVRDTAGSRIWLAYEQVVAYGPVLRWADVPTLHQLRIAGKWLRYTLEFVREALGDDAAPLIARVTALQDHLGLMNDADVSASMARTFLVEHAGELHAGDRGDPSG